MQISHPTMGSPSAMVTSQAELVVTGSRNLDNLSNSERVIDYQHGEIHEGHHFTIKNFETLASGATITFSVTTPNNTTWTHMFFNVYGTNQVEFKTWENATLSGGTAVTSFNNNRNSSIASTLLINKNPVISGVAPTSGTLLEARNRGYNYTNPSVSDFSASISREEEWVLRSGTTYMWEIKSQADANVVDYEGYWYEHANREV